MDSAAKGQAGKGNGKAGGKAGGKPHVPGRAGLFLGGGHSVNQLKPGGKWHRSHGPSRERRILRHAIRGLQQFAADTAVWAVHQQKQQQEMAGFTSGATSAMGKMSGVMQAQSNQLAFLSHTIGSSRAEKDQEMAEMRQAMEESIRQRVAEEAGGDKSKT